MIIGFYGLVLLAATEQTQLVQVQTESVRTANVSKSSVSSSSKKLGIQTRTEAVINADGTISVACVDGHEHEARLSSSEEPK
jgi:spore coat protein U-like protein